MKTPLLRSAILAIVTASALALVSTARADDPKQIDKSATWTNGSGGTGTASSVVTRDNGNVARKGQWTNAAGGTGNWQSQTKWNKATQTATTNGSVTRPNGNTSTWQGTAVRNSPGNISQKGTITLANGKTLTYAAADTRTAPGSWNQNQTITNANGKTIDRNIDTTVSNGTGTRIVTTTLPNGQVEMHSEKVTVAAVTPTPTPNP
jgi:hypothetical protein